MWASMNIEAITREKIDGIKPLWEKLNAHHLAKSSLFKDHFSAFTFEKRMESLKKRDLLIAYVAEHDGEKIGYCVATVDGSVGEIDSLFVREEHRGKGAGEELFSLALRWLGGQKCETIKVAVAEGNESVLGFYRRFGFAKRFTVMEKVSTGRAVPFEPLSG